MRVRFVRWALVSGPPWTLESFNAGVGDSRVSDGTGAGKVAWLECLSCRAEMKNPRYLVPKKITSWLMRCVCCLFCRSLLCVEIRDALITILTKGPSPSPGRSRDRRPIGSPGSSRRRAPWRVRSGDMSGENRDGAAARSRDATAARRAVFFQRSAVSLARLLSAPALPFIDVRL